MADDTKPVVEQRRLAEVYCTLEAMAHNYRNGHSWDRLDGEIVTEAAHYIRHLYDHLEVTLRQSPPSPDEVERPYWMPRQSRNEIVDEAIAGLREDIAALSPAPDGERERIKVHKIETVTGDFYTEPGEPIWRIMLNDYCADFPSEQAARNFADQIERLGRHAGDAE